jgi:phosphoribosyl 1,2-cyclic phosphodiesterase/ActR/RegA family two-component response regulator
MRTVLIIDDDPVFRSLVAGWLADSGWRVLEAADGRQGLEMAEAHHPQIVLCDLLMAPVNGFQFCRKLREIPSLKDIRVIITSGRDFDADRRSALEAGADDYLTKPINVAQLTVLLSRFHPATGEDAAPPPAGAPASDPSLSLRFWGVRGSIATPGPATFEFGGNTPCIEVRAAGRIIILDAGTGLRALGKSLLAEFGDAPLDLTLLLTHTHWDHIQGLPFFKPVYQPRNRLRILGAEGARKGLHGVLTDQMEAPFFPIGLREVPANITVEELAELSFNLGPIQVRAAFANHPGICVGYRLSYAGRSLAFFPDNEVRHSVKPLDPNNPDADAEFAQAENARLAAFLRGVDVLVMDTQYDREEYKEHEHWGHGCLDDVVPLAIAAEVKKLFLFHHDPDHEDQKIAAMAAHGRTLAARLGSKLEVEAAREGLTLSLPALAPESAQAATR